MVLSNVIVDITISSRSFVFSQSDVQISTWVWAKPRDVKLKLYNLPSTFAKHVAIFSSQLLRRLERGVSKYGSLKNEYSRA